MRIAVASTGPTPNDSVDMKFGRCAYLLIAEDSSIACEALENPARDLGRHAGALTARLIQERGAGVVLTGNCGPESFQVLRRAGIRAVMGVTGTVRDALERFKAGQLRFARRANVDKYWGLLQGMKALS
jgi:predicted Fe-Mo cluster-binding NifX family protein